MGRKLARTKGGYLALTPSSLRVGDSVGLFKGGKTLSGISAERKQDSMWQMLG